MIKDIWRVGLVRAPVEALLSPGGLNQLPVSWLPSPGPLRFDADPFGVWRGDRLYVFVETYDYRDRVGAIDVLTFDRDLRFLERRPALREPWHLSYPFVFEAEGETWMLPEAHRSGKLTLYRCEAFPDRWAPHTTLELDAVAIDATPLFHDGRWWLFYTPATTKAAKVSELRAAYASSITGPWTSHPDNPLWFDASKSRPGGRPIVKDGIVTLFMQDCRTTYGGAMRPLRLTTLTPERIEAEAGEVIFPPPGFAPYDKGFHTVSSAGAVTLIDAKRFLVSPASLWLDLRRALLKLSRRG
ncbi:MAG: hypothetical protein J7521_09445 [Caulobacter sp.]|nr:hypothetical protein [Caulobacter sp.]